MTSSPSPNPPSGSHEPAERPAAVPWSARADLWTAADEHRLRYALPELRVLATHADWWLSLIAGVAVYAVTFGGIQKLLGRPAHSLLTGACVYGLLTIFAVAVLSPWQRARRELAAGVPGAAHLPARLAIVGGPLPTDDETRTAAAALLDHRRATASSRTRRLTGRAILLLCCCPAAGLALTDSPTWWTVGLVLLATGVLQPLAARSSRGRQQRLFAALAAART